MEISDPCDSVRLRRAYYSSYDFRSSLQIQLFIMHLSIETQAPQPRATKTCDFATLLQYKLKSDVARYTTQI